MTDKPTAAKGPFPYPHRTVAEAMPLKPLRHPDPAEFVARSGFVERERRNRFSDTLDEVTDDEIVDAVRRAWHRTAA